MEGKNFEELAVMLARLLNDYDDKPSSDTWAAIQKLALEVLK